MAVRAAKHTCMKANAPSIIFKAHAASVSYTHLANAVLQRENEALARAFSNIYLTIVELDLRSEQASVIKSSN